jgi:L-ascorbate metabolism protein UlaG (beta-lactamase superfamily)
MKEGTARRKIVGGLGLGIAGLGAGLLYRAAPAFWQQWARELGEPIAAPPHIPHPKRWSDRGVYAAWLGHATVLLKVDGFTILTDPVFSDRIGLGLGPLTLGLKRLVLPALSIEALPRVDLILLSHAHMDHIDLPSLRTLESPTVRLVTASRTADLLRVDRYAEVRELGWDEQADLGPVRVRAIRVRHWGARMRSDDWRGYNGYLLTIGRYRILFAGDTAVTTAFRSLGDTDLALLPVGAYDPWIANHCSPEQAWQMANDARAAHVLPIHHQTFHLSREPVHEPIERLMTAAGSAAGRVALTQVGEEFSLT